MTWCSCATNAASTSPARPTTDRGQGTDTAIAALRSFVASFRIVTFPSPRIVDSRRLTGPNLFSSYEGALLHVAFDDAEGKALLGAWYTAAQRLTDRLGWNAHEPVIRRHPGGAQCYVAAPIDALLAATEVNEQAWLAAERAVAGRVAVDEGDIVARLRVHVQHERAPALVALQQAAHARSLTFTFDDDDVSLGAGAGSRTFSRSTIPTPAQIDWASLHDIPIALVTGSNGKTTTTRLLAAMLARTGHTPGLTSTDGVWCAGEEVDRGDYSGPVGARLVLRDRRVTAAVLETARGGMLRRGLATHRANVSIVTRVSADHMGEYGIYTLDDLGEAKLIVARALIPGGSLVLNADDDTLARLAPGLAFPITWFSLDPLAPVVVAHLAEGGAACVLQDGELHYHSAAGNLSLGAVRDMPLTLGGAASYNVANALAASAAALALDVPVAAIRDTLSTFGSSVHDNPGRLARLEFRGAQLVVDFAHNPDGWRALSHATRAIPSSRQIVVIGQGGDRDDTALDELAEAVWLERPEVIVLKEMPKYARGRPPGEVTDRLALAFTRLGAPASSIRRAPDELGALTIALAESRPGDLLVLSVHEDYRAAMQHLVAQGATLLRDATASTEASSASSV